MAWWEVPYGSGNGFCRVETDSPEEAKARAEELLRDIGILPGRMHAAWKKLVRETK